jgi:hypothetical protein
VLNQGGTLPVIAFPNDLKSQLDRSRIERMPEEAVWDLCSMFLEGKQWLEFDERMAHWRVRENFETARGLSHLTVNLILNSWRTIRAKLGVGAPSFGVVPASDSAEDRSKAKATELALQYWWSASQMKRAFKQVLNYMCSWGTGALHVYFDPGPPDMRPVDSGKVDIHCSHCGWEAPGVDPPVSQESTYCPVCKAVDIRVEGVTEWREFYPKGMVRVEAVSPYNLFFEPGVRQWRDSRWIAVRRFETRRGLMEAFPAARDYIANAQSARPIAERMDGGRAAEGRVEVFDVYWKDGRHAVVMDNVYLWQEQLPFDGMIPVRPVSYTDFPDRLWGYGIVEPQLDAQWEYNRTRSQVADNARLMGNPKWKVPRGASLDQGAINDEPGEVIWYNLSGGAPEMVPPVPLPGYVLDHAIKCHSDMMDTIGLHGTAQGKREVGVTAAKAMQQLAEFGADQLGLTMEEAQEALEDVAIMGLQLMVHYYTEPMAYRMQDDTGSIILGEISRTSIVNQPEVFIEAGTLFRGQAAEREARIMQWVEMGLLEPAEARDEIVFRTGMKWASQRTRGLIHAREMLAEVIRGRTIEVLPTDDVEAFAEVFGEFMRTGDSAYLKLPRDIQETIRNLHVACAYAQASDEEYYAAMSQRTVFPRSGSVSTSLEGAAVSPTVAGMQQHLGAAEESRGRETRLKSLRGTGMGKSETQSGGADGMTLPHQARGAGLGRVR